MSDHSVASDEMFREQTVAPTFAEYKKYHELQVAVLYDTLDPVQLEEILAATRHKWALHKCNVGDSVWFLHTGKKRVRAGEEPPEEAESKGPTKDKRKQTGYIMYRSEILKQITAERVASDEEAKKNNTYPTLAEDEEENLHKEALRRWNLLSEAEKEFCNEQAKISQDEKKFAKALSDFMKKKSAPTTDSSDE